MYVYSSDDQKSGSRYFSGDFAYDMGMLEYKTKYRMNSLKESIDLVTRG